MRIAAKFLFLIVLSNAFIFSLYAEVRLPAIIGDNMVLQQKSDVSIWGWAAPGEQIAVEGSWMKGHEVTTTADEKGEWKIKIKTQEAGGPFTLTIHGDQTIELHNVMIGEVWICSGQSNMEMPVKGWGETTPIKNSAEEISTADHPEIRLFTVKKDIAIAPKADVEGEWAVATPETVSDFSATAYFFGKALHQKLDVPIGLIHTSWGGTVAEAWTSNGALKSLGDFNKELERLDSLRPYLKTILTEDSLNLQQWNQEMKAPNIAYAAETFNDAEWKTMELPTTWEAAGYPGLDGIVWFRKAVKIPASWAGKTLNLDLGPIDDMDITWFNGQKVGATKEEGHWNDNRSYEVPGDLVKPGRNIIAVRVIDPMGAGGIYGDKKLLKIYPVDETPEKGISLAGEWNYKIETIKPKASFSNNPNQPTVLYNGMIAPLVPFTIKGAIWYQGESNVGRASQYEKLFPLMINDWRNKWDQGAFPFYFVQIAPFPYGGSNTKGAALRDAQRKALKVPNTGMAVTLDIGDTTNIHPANKQEVGRRLSLWALANTYGKKDVVYSGPLFQKMKIRGNKITVYFDHTDGGLVAKEGKLTNFEIAGADGDFLPAKAIIKGNKVVVHADNVLHPQAVRYAWKDNAQPQLFNKAGLPASSFSAEK